MRRLAQLIIGTNLVARVQGLQTSTTRSKKGWEYQWWWLHWLHGKEKAPQSRTRSQFGSCSSSSFQSLLIFFNRFEKLGEVAFPKTPTPALLVLLPFLILEHASNPLNYLYKYGGPAHFTQEKNQSMLMPTILNQSSYPQQQHTRLRIGLSTQHTIKLIINKPTEEQGEKLRRQIKEHFDNLHTQKHQITANCKSINPYVW